MVERDHRAAAANQGVENARFCQFRDFETVVSGVELEEEGTAGGFDCFKASAFTIMILHDYMILVLPLALAVISYL